jgi:hypothetical protein
MDKLEEHIRKNRKDLDMHNPSSEVWKRVQRELKPGKSLSFKWISIAAMIIVVMGSALMISNLKKGTGNKNLQIEEAGHFPENQQLKETEIYYNNLVSSLYNEAAPLLTSNPEIRKELTTDIYQLDSIYSDIKKDLKDNIANQEVVEALIQNYRIKIRLLEDMLIILREKNEKPEKSRNHEL